jgi:hypothetical protein
MDHLDRDVQQLDRIIEELQRIRTRRCEPKSNTNPTYLTLSNAVTQVRKARNDLAAERSGPSTEGQGAGGVGQDARVVGGGDDQ